MTKARPPLSFDQAITRIAGLLGWAACAKIVRRSQRTVRYWSEPDCRTTPTIKQAADLDAAYLAAGGDEAPLLEAYRTLLEMRRAEAEACSRELAVAVANVARESSDAIATSIAVTQPGASPSDVHRALVETQEARSAMRSLQRLLKSFLVAGAGPAATKGGAQ